MIVDSYHLDECQWIKLLCTKEIETHFSEKSSSQVKSDNLLYKIDSDAPEFLESFVGIIVEGSEIQKIRFEYAHRIPISEGQLINVNVRDKAVLYQVVQGITEAETPFVVFRY